MSETDEPIRLTLAITREEYMEASRAQQRHDPEHDWLRAYRLAGIGATGIGLLCLVRGEPPMRWVAPAALIVLGLWLAIHPVWIAYRRVDQAWAQADHSFRNTSVEIQAAGLTFSDPNMRSEIAWETVASIVESKSLFLLFLRSGTGPVVIPKRAFSSAEEMTRFRRMLAAHVQGPCRGFPVVQR